MRILPYKREIKSDRVQNQFKENLIQEKNQFNKYESSKLNSEQPDPQDLRIVDFRLKKRVNAKKSSRFMRENI